MAKIHTHYDNLSVSRNAPPEVIRAAYKTLSQKYHPDKNPGNSEAARIMAIMNGSYDVLSDVGKRMIGGWRSKSACRRKPPSQIPNPIKPTDKPRNHLRWEQK